MTKYQLVQLWKNWERLNRWYKPSEDAALKIELDNFYAEVRKRGIELEVELTEDKMRLIRPKCRICSGEGGKRSEITQMWTDCPACNVFDLLEED